MRNGFDATSRRERGTRIPTLKDAIRSLANDRLRPIAVINSVEHHNLMMLRLCCASLFVLAFVGCSKAYPVEAVFIRGKLHFQAEDKLNGCLNHFRVETEAGEVMWQLEGDFKSAPCKDNFPLEYGIIPEGLTGRVAAKPLKAGVLYKIEGSDGDRYYGAFRYRHTITVTNTPEIARAM